MPKTNDIHHSILIVSASEQFVSIVRKSLPGLSTADIGKSAATARRYILERYYDMIVINAPLPDETGEEFAIDAADTCNASVLLVSPQDMFEDVLENVTDHGVFALPKPSPRGRIDKAIRYLSAIQNRMHSLEQKAIAAEEKTQELRTVTKVKFLLMERRHMTEDEAHRYIGKRAMDNGISREKAARRILDEIE